MIPTDRIKLLSRRVRVQVESLPEFAKATTIASYVATPDEVQTRGIIEDAIRQGKKVIAPRTDARAVSMNFHELTSMSTLEEGPFGIMEPPAGAKKVRLSQSQFVLVPVVAWDDKGQRLGHGMGFYDRELASRGAAVAVGLGFESQNHGLLPANGSDVPLDIMVTEERTIRFRRVDLD